MKFIKDLGMQYATPNSRQRDRFGLYECPKCKKHFKAKTSDIKSKRKLGCSSSCTQSTHGKRNTRLFNIWAMIKQRCNNKNNPSYKDYGKRGITICKEWNNFQTFYDWAQNNGYNKNLTIERIKVNKGYSPENCTWIDLKLQALNTRKNINFNQDEMSEIIEFYENNFIHGNGKELLKLININKNTFNQIKKGNFQIKDNKVYTTSPHKYKGNNK